MVNGIPLLGKIDDFVKTPESVFISVRINLSELDHKIKNEFEFSMLIYPSVIEREDKVKIEKGTIICADSVLTCNKHIEEFVTLNLMSHIEHVTVISEFSACMAGINISGEVLLNKKAYIATGAKITNKIGIGESSVIGAGAVAVVSKDIQPIKFHNEFKSETDEK